MLHFYIIAHDRVKEILEVIPRNSFPLIVMAHITSYYQLLLSVANK